MAGQFVTRGRCGPLSGNGFGEFRRFTLAAEIAVEEANGGPLGVEVDEDGGGEGERDTEERSGGRVALEPMDMRGEEAVERVFAVRVNEIEDVAGVAYEHQPGEVGVPASLGKQAARGYEEERRQSQLEYAIQVDAGPSRREPGLDSDQEKAAGYADDQCRRAKAAGSLVRDGAAEIVGEDADEEFEDDIPAVELGEYASVREGQANEHSGEDQGSAYPSCAALGDQKSDGEREIEEHLVIEAPANEEKRLDDAAALGEGNEQQAFE